MRRTRARAGFLGGALAAALASLALGSPLRAEEGPMPTFRGKAKVHEAINSERGAIFELGGGVTMVFPKGLPVGKSRLVTLKKARKSLPAKLVHPKFKRVGPPLDFNGAFSTEDRPIVVSIPSGRDPAGKARRLVLAMEIGTFCEEKNKRYKLGNGLCSGFELHEARYDKASNRMIAELPSTGGLRMQFGTVPREPKGAED